MDVATEATQASDLFVHKPFGNQIGDNVPSKVAVNNVSLFREEVIDLDKQNGELETSVKDALTTVTQDSVSAATQGVIEDSIDKLSQANTVLNLQKTSYNQSFENTFSNDTDNKVSLKNKQFYLFSSDDLQRDSRNHESSLRSLNFVPMLNTGSVLDPVTFLEISNAQNIGATDSSMVGKVFL